MRSTHNLVVHMNIKKICMVSEYYILRHSLCHVDNYQGTKPEITFITSIIAEF